MRLVVVLGVANLAHEVPAQVVHHVQRLRDVLAEHAADAVAVDEPWHVHFNDVALWRQDSPVALPPRCPKAAHARLSSASEKRPPAPAPFTRRVKLLTTPSSFITDVC